MFARLSWKGYIHDIVFTVISLGSIPFFIPKLFSESGRDKIKRGVMPRFSLRKLGSCDVVIHSSSLGETKNALLFSPLLEKEIGADIKHTVFTGTAEKTFGASQTKKVVPIPMPLYLVMRTFLPDNLKMLIFYESDFWPAYIISAKEKGAKIFVVSGRLSEKSAYLYRKFRMKYVFSMVDKVFSTSPENSRRFKEAGFQNVYDSINLKNLVFLRNNHISGRKKAGRKKIVLGISLRGEEEIKFFLGAQTHLKHMGISSMFFVAPRHNFKEAENTIKKTGKKFIKLSEIEPNGTGNPISTIKKQKAEVILVDKYGVIDKILPMCDFSFVGGSVLPFGGHNVLEPLSHGVPTSAGENIWRIEERNELIRKGVLHVVRTSEELARLITKSHQLRKTVEIFCEEKKREVQSELRRILGEIVLALKK